MSLVKNGHQFVCLTTGCYRSSVFSISIFYIRDSFGLFGSDDNEFLESRCWECRAGDVKGDGRDVAAEGALQSGSCRLRSKQS